MEVDICRLCLNFVKKGFELIDAVTRQMLAVLSLKVDLDACENSIVCHDCVEIIKKSYYFKSACIDTEEIILSSSAINDGAELDMKDVYQYSKGPKIATDVDFYVCRFCMEQTGSEFVSFDVLLDNAMFVDMLKVFMPKMVLNVIKDPVICTSCWENLESYFKFTQNCLDTEEKIIKYRQSEGINNSTSRIKLSDISGFSFKDVVDEIKQEITHEDVELIKSEAIDIKDEDVNLENSSLKLELFKCDKCTFETKYKNVLKSHVLTHMDASIVEMHKCTICTFETKHKYTLKRHSLIHKDSTQVEMHKCRLCTYETKRKQTLKKHLLIHKDTAEVEMHKCPICTYETKHKNYLKKHIVTHKDPSEVEMYKCESCTYETKYERNMKSHVLNHKKASEVEMHKCEKCTYETKHKDNLRRHMLVHEEALKCGMCSCETKQEES